MSGFAGILNLDGAPVDRGLLESLAQSMEYRGPDATAVWCGENIGLAHTRLRTSEGESLAAQPMELHGRFRVVADARIDARDELVAKLRAKDDAAPGLSRSTSDAELILRAYEAWGTACVEHLLGDFSFTIWDASRRRLFAARDHMGVKPFYYAHCGPHLIFSNTLNCVRQHPSVSNRLNEFAIADFLLFDINQDPLTTSFADIQRLPAAHSLQCEQGVCSTRRYWSLSVTEPVQFKKPAEFVERFRQLLDQAVADRLRTDSVGMLMSGGLDSSTVAASAKRLLQQSGAGRLFAHTVVLDGVIADDEGHYAQLATDALGIPVEFRATNDCALFDRADKPQYLTPFPEHTAWPDVTTDLLRKISVNSRVALTGNGSDPGLSSRISAHFRDRFRERKYTTALADAFRYLAADGRLSRLYLRTRWRLLFSVNNPFSNYPAWLNPEFERQAGLRDRWMTYGMPDRRTAMQRESGVTSVRPEASVVMSHVAWQNMFEALDPGATQVPVEVRHPFFDLRLVTFLLGLPRLPWCCDKELLRQASRGILPESVRLRRKSPLDADPTVALLSRPGSAWVDGFEAVPELNGFVQRNRIPAVFGEQSPGTAWVNLRPLSLNYWLRGQALYGYNCSGNRRV